MDESQQVFFQIYNDKNLLHTGGQPANLDKFGQNKAVKSFRDLKGIIDDVIKTDPSHSYIIMKRYLNIK